MNHHVAARAHPLLTQIRNLLMDDRVMVRLPHSNIWVAGVVVSVLQYFNAIRSDGYRIEYSSRGGWHVELFPASPDHILPATRGPPPAHADDRSAGSARRQAY
ncbi:uncharacterized protein SCHCODRAFT_02626879 [Schizophyllum commune H4-8]|uniref:uncharacterized protein n=1 Tax=Schizophyllum commune (strain H4-8 / FGSC 9210) TaxID=578458 RepID=UPI00215F9A77|nr:uncharacterized protein SCHCODRAFT_02626879 [Schizophyllum commune H4-8]KAI5892698.1 hypothetical protein SCHCODRAFT_02626879 [Schizophyllum commune H4-8]